MNRFENRRQLPIVLDEVHRNTVAARLQEVGFVVQTGSWSELDDLTAQYFERGNEGDVFLDVTYEGKQLFGPLCGNSQRLVESGPTDYCGAKQEGTLGDWVWRRHILVSPPGQRTSRAKSSRVLLMPDSPPLAVHGDDWVYVIENFSAPRDVEADSKTLQRIENAFGPEAIEFVGEDAAAGIIRALRQDTAQIAALWN